MFQIIIIPNNSQANTALFYRTKEAAENAHKNVHDMQKGVGAVEVLKQSDDFGVTLTMDRANICYAMMIDVEKQQEIGNFMGAPQRGSKIIGHAA